MNNSTTALKQAINTMHLEAEAILRTAQSLSQSPAVLESVIKAISHCIEHHGRVVLTGMGKSGHIARKISSTMASTGTSSIYLHPAEAAHGDLGMVGTRDIVIALSQSGESAEIIALLPQIKRLSVPLITMTGYPQSTLGKTADFHLDTSVVKEACPHNLAPTTSTAVQLAIGDALALGILVARGFTAEDFGRYHPGGALGRRLIKVADIMHLGREVPKVLISATLSEALAEMTRGSLGMTAIIENINGIEQIKGVFTDGDLRRLLENQSKTPLPANANLLSQNIATLMSKNPCVIGLERMAAEAVALMEERRINQLLVINHEGHLVGALNMQDLLRHRVV